MGGEISSDIDRSFTITLITSLVRYGFKNKKVGNFP